jgi:hypothetical protein
LYILNTVIRNYICVKRKRETKPCVCLIACKFKSCFVMLLKQNKCHFNFEHLWHVRMILPLFFSLFIYKPLTLVSYSYYLNPFFIFGLSLSLSFYSKSLIYLLVNVILNLYFFRQIKFIIFNSFIKYFTTTTFNKQYYDDYYYYVKRNKLIVCEFFFL